MIKLLPPVGTLLTALMLSASAYGADIKVEEAWTLATPPGKKSANVYFLITSKQAAVLTGATSPASGSVALRSMLHKGGRMKTIDLPSIDLPANSRVDMTSMHSYHLTLIDLKAPLKAGGTVPLTLNIDMGDKRNLKIDVTAEVKPPKTAAH